ncbi:MAG: SDR family NAD(P)-dependent oxidoreductase [Acidobacteriota bacterium]
MVYRTKAEIQSWLITHLSELTGIEPPEIDLYAPFSRLGVDSIDSVTLAADLGDWLEYKLSSTIFWDYATIAALVEHLAEKSAISQAADNEIAQTGSATNDTDTAIVTTSISDKDRQDTVEPIAIVGMSCRFPGAESVEQFWQLLRNGIDAIQEVPSWRWDIDTFYDPDPLAPGKMNTRWGGFVERLDQFDPYFFGISPREAAHMDPQQRLMLKIAWEALENAGLVPEELAGSQTGVFIGIFSFDYAHMLANRINQIDAYVAPGSVFCITANRLSFFFDFHGPSLALDTACSSSLVAIHLACQSLRSGESTLALAGGVNLLVYPSGTVSMTKMGVMSPDGHCKPFDASANGYVRSEGAGIVVLKPLAKALVDGDPIQAIIRGSAVNQDGRSNGLTAPNQLAQEAMLREAYRCAGISPSQVQYIEAHGTGTVVGDPIEVKALANVLATDRPADSLCTIGSLKTNIGHLETAAGVAGVIKTALMFKHKEIPPSLHFHQANPHIPFAEIPLRVPQQLTSWSTNGQSAIAGVSAFGFGGTNAHIVLEEPPPRPEISVSPRPLQLLPISARSDEALKDFANSYKQFLTSSVDTRSLYNICYTASVRRSHHEHRLAIVAHSQEEFQERLEAFLAGENRIGMSTSFCKRDRSVRLAFVFSGQGPQWWAMGRELLTREPVFRAVIERCDKLLSEYASWSLLKELTVEEEQSRINETEITQPAIFALQVALAALWRSWGVIPDAVVGHSMGEVAAAHVAGVLNLPDALRIIYHRGRLMQRTTGQGKTAAVELPLEEAQRALAGYEATLSVAACNSPTSTTLSGEPAALETVINTISEQGVFARLLRVNYAFHSPQMEPLRRELIDALQDITPAPATTPIYSTVIGELADGRTFNAQYWSRNLREPVLFTRAMDELVMDGYDTFLEISPYPVLASSISQCLRHRNREGVVLASLRRGEEEQAVMLGTLGALYVQGYPIDWRNLYIEGGEVVQLPSYPWQEERCWFKNAENIFGPMLELSRPQGNRIKRHPLLTRYLTAADSAYCHYWETEIDRQSFHLGDHQIQGTVVLPGMTYLEMALAAAAEVYGGDTFMLKDVEFRKALFLSEPAPRTLQISLNTGKTGEAAFSIHSCAREAETEQPAWVLHALGKFQTFTESGQGIVLTDLFNELRNRGCEEISGENFYHTFQQYGFTYGPSFQGIERILRGTKEAWGELSVPAPLIAESKRFLLHPAVLDACIQVLASVSLESTNNGENLLVPVRVEQVKFYRRATTQLYSYARLRPNLDKDAYPCGDVSVLNVDGQLVVELLGIQVQPLESALPRQETVDDWLYELQWQPRQHDAQTENTALLARGSWLIFVDTNGIGKQLADLLIEQGERCVLVLPGDTYQQLAQDRFIIPPDAPTELKQLLEVAFPVQSPACIGVVHLWSLDIPITDEITLTPLAMAESLNSISVLRLVQQLVNAGWTKTPHLWLVTRGAQPVADRDIALAQSPLWGLGRVIAAEHPELQCVRIDLDPINVEGAHEIFQEICSTQREDQVAWRDSTRYVLKLARYAASRAALPASLMKNSKLLVGESQSLQLEAAPNGVLAELGLRVITRRPLNDNEAEIEVQAIGLNFKDLTKAMRISPDTLAEANQIGYECAGKIVRLGAQVTGLTIGDEVIAIALASPGCPFAIADARLVVTKPAELSFAAAATLPVAFTTAYYALYRMGRISRSERILIHCAAGGVGLAAVQLAQRAGAEIFATASSEEKRALLASMGVKHLYDSRSGDFVEQVRTDTGGEGVDLVLNSLAEYIPESLSLLAPGGRFLELGRSIAESDSHLELTAFKGNRAFFAIDLDLFFYQRPQLIHSIWLEVMEYFRDGSLKPLPFELFPLQDAAMALYHLAERKNIGKVLLSPADVVYASVRESLPAAITIRGDATYLITGGLGGLGLVVAEWLVEQGARHLVLVARRTVESNNRVLDSLKAAGAKVIVAQADVAENEQMAQLLKEIESSLPPLRGIVHTAGILDDGMLLQQDPSRFRKVSRPKIDGAWNLHSLTLDKQLDLFLLFSSLAAIFGSPGQSNYAAANAFLDALAYYRRSQGLPIISINWGPWSEVGMAARPHTDGRLFRGIGFISPQQGVELLTRFLRQPVVQIGVIPIDWPQWCQANPLVSKSPLFVDLLAGQADQQTAESGEEGSGDLLDRLMDLPLEERLQWLENRLQEIVAKVLALPAAKLDIRQPLNKYGLDSLIAIELKTRIELAIGVTVPIVSLLQGVSLTQLAGDILTQLVAIAEQRDAAILLTKIDQLSGNEVDSLLGELLAEDGAAD